METLLSKLPDVSKQIFAKGATDTAIGQFNKRFPGLFCDLVVFDNFPRILVIRVVQLILDDAHVFFTAISQQMIEQAGFA